MAEREEAAIGEMATSSFVSYQFPAQGGPSDEKYSLPDGAYQPGEPANATLKSPLLSVTARVRTR